MQGHRHERAVAVVESVGLAGVVLALVMALSVPLAGQGTSLAGAIAARIDSAIGGTPDLTAPALPKWHKSTTRSGAREHRVAGGEIPQRVARGDLRLSPLLEPIGAAWQDTLVSRGSTRSTGITITACALCVDAGWATDSALGARAGTDGSPASGVHVGAEGSAHAALFATELLARMQGTVGMASGHAQVRMRALVGADATVRGDLQLGRDRQRIEAELGAATGAVARTQTAVGVRAFGIALDHTAYAEGWAGAGAKAKFGVARDHGRLAWEFGWGAALGFGGAAGWSGSIDVSAVPPKQRRAAGQALAAIALQSMPFATVPLMLNGGR